MHLYYTVELRVQSRRWPVALGGHGQNSLRVWKWSHFEEGIVDNFIGWLFFFFFLFIFFYFWLCWVFVSVLGLSPVAASGGHSSLRCAGLSLSRPLLLWSTGSRRAGSVVVAHGLSCSAACGIFPDQGSNPCPLHWQADSQPLHHQGSPIGWLFVFLKVLSFWKFGPLSPGV